MDEQTVEIRKIENGYIVRESGLDGNGRYRSTERFSATNPVAGLKMGDGKGKGNMMSAATRYLKGKK